MNMSLDPPMMWVALALVLLGDFGLEVLEQGRVEGADVRVVAAPFVEAETLLFGEEGAEEPEVGCGGGDVGHALEADVLGRLSSVKELDVGEEGAGMTAMFTLYSQILQLIWSCL